MQVGTAGAGAQLGQGLRGQGKGHAALAATLRELATTRSLRAGQQCGRKLQF